MYGMEYEVEGVRPRGRPKRTWTDVQKDCQVCKLNYIVDGGTDKGWLSSW